MQNIFLNTTLVLVIVVSTPDDGTQFANDVDLSLPDWLAGRIRPWSFCLVILYTLWHRNAHIFSLSRDMKTMFYSFHAIIGILH